MDRGTPRRRPAAAARRLAVASGRVVFGAVGDGERLEFTVIGDAVNLAAKLEKHNKEEKTRAVTDSTYAGAEQQGYVAPAVRERGGGRFAGVPIWSILWFCLGGAARRGFDGRSCVALPFVHYKAYVIRRVRTGWRSAIVGNNYDIILIGLVAIFLILRLRSVLGNARQRTPAGARSLHAAACPAAGCPRLGDAPSSTQSGNDNVDASADRRRPPRAAYHRRRAAFAPRSCRPDVGRCRDSRRRPRLRADRLHRRCARGFHDHRRGLRQDDTAALRPLLDGPTFASFEAAIRGRAERKEKAETTLIGFEASDIAAASLQDSRSSSPSVSSASRSTCCAMPTADHRRQSERSSEGRSISGRSVATPSQATPTGC